MTLHHVPPSPDASANECSSAEGTKLTTQSIEVTTAKPLWPSLFNYMTIPEAAELRASAFLCMTF